MEPTPRAWTARLTAGSKSDDWRRSICQIKDLTQDLEWMVATCKLDDQAHDKCRVWAKLDPTASKGIKIEEWDLDVYYRDVNTLRTESKIVELAQAGKSVEALVQTVISKSLDKDGKQLFTQYDKDALMNDADPSVVLKLSRALSGGDLPAVEEIEKN